jgi:hypothetical protein
VVAKLNPHGEYVRGLTEIGIQRYELDNQGFFSSNEEGDEWQNTKMAESAQRFKAPPLNKTRDWKPHPRFKQILTLLRSSAEAEVSTKAALKKSTTPEQLPRTISSVVELHCDIMFVEGIAILISVGKPLDLCMVTVLGSGVGARNSQAMRTAMTSHYDAYWKRRFKIKVVVMDGESSAAKAAFVMNHEDS